jgi:hypothetical protein
VNRLLLDCEYFVDGVRPLYSGKVTDAGRSLARDARNIRVRVVIIAE